MIENINNGFAYVIKSNGINCTELANILGISKQNVSRWISSDRKIPDKYLDKLAEIFNIDADFLIKKLTNKDKIELLQNEIDKLKEVD